jgi:hypothetical protein
MAFDIGKMEYNTKTPRFYADRIGLGLYVISISKSFISYATPDISHKLFSPWKWHKREQLVLRGIRFSSRSSYRLLLSTSVISLPLLVE